MCLCGEGYTGTTHGTPCEDIDECFGENNCDVNALCTNTQGSYTCACKEGFSGDGFTCVEIDFCPTYPDIENAFVPNNSPDDDVMWHPDDVITYQCEPNFVQVGWNRYQCTNGSWSVEDEKDELECLPPDVSTDFVITFDSDKLLDGCDDTFAPYPYTDEEFAGEFPNFNRQVMMAEMLNAEWRSNTSTWLLRDDVSQECGDDEAFAIGSQSFQQLTNDIQYTCADRIFHWNGIKCSEQLIEMYENAGFDNRNMIIIFAQNMENNLYTTGVWPIFVNADVAADVSDVSDVFVISTVRREDEDWESNVNYWNTLLCDKDQGESCLLNGAFLGSQWDEARALADNIRKFVQEHHDE
jgi:hypothetical protein